MADQPKKKPASSKTTNDSRPNRKANKQKPEDYRSGRKEYRGSKTRKARLTPLQKALLGGGAMVSISRAVEGSVAGRWKFEPSKMPFDATQARLNRSLYPHLFDGR